MNCQRAQESFVDHQSGTLAEADALAVRTHLKTCLACQKEWSALQETLLKLDRLPAPAPSPRLREQFYLMLEEEQHSLERPSPFALARNRIDSFFASLLPARPVFQAAFAAILLLGGLVIGGRWLQHRENDSDRRVQTELAELRQRVDSMGQLMAFSAQQQQSGNERLQGVLASLDQSQPDERTLAELLHILAFDPSTNVRLGALEALYPHVKRDAVRAGILAALPRERSPLVQVAMIDFFAAARDRNAAPALQDMTRSRTIDQAVREAAQRALVQL